MAVKKGKAVRKAKAKRQPVKKTWLSIPALPQNILRQVVLRDANQTIDITGLVTPPSITASIYGDSELSFAALDNRLELVNESNVASFFDSDRNLILDPIWVFSAGCWWTLQKLATNETGWQFTCEDKAIGDSRTYDKPLAMTRASATRAMFIKRMVDQIQPATPAFYCPELTERQPVVAATDGTARSDSVVLSQRSRSASGFGENGSKVTVKRVAAKQAQLAAISAALTEGVKLGANRRVLIALVMCGTQESVWQPLNHGDAARNDTIGYLQQGPEWIAPSNTKDPAKAARAFLIGYQAKVGGKGKVQGWKQRHGSLHAASGNLESMIKAVQISIGGYGQWEKEATKTVDLWLAVNNGTNTRGATLDTVTADNQSDYVFRRGEAGGKREDTWVAGQRLANDVGWNLFAVANSVWYASQPLLMQPRPVLEITRDMTISMPYEIDAREAVDQIDVILPWSKFPWELHPGLPVSVAGEPLASGKWLISNTAWDSNTPQISLTLVRPAAKKREPAAEQQQKSGKQGGTGLGFIQAGDSQGKDLALAYYKNCIEFSNQTPGYVYGGGHGPAIERLKPTQGLDCSSSTSAALYKTGIWKAKPSDKNGSGGFRTAIVSGNFNTWGQPGRGKYFTIWYNPKHVFTEFHSTALGVQYERFDTVPGGGPKMRNGAVDTSRFQARHWPGCLCLYSHLQPGRYRLSLGMLAPW